ncbi:EF-hand domain-containing protein [Herbidospora mongoliensis]|uniref:EF-hand domain-containing protein n=1 Tax=Herbidospora mongoliensis TaxID=688067 RepID=UPI000A6517D6|nr:EF-hand domain-containing protein [Herbidospora mongoliensis]
MDLKATFDAIDADHDGYVTEAEIVAHFPHLPAEALGAYATGLDADGDGRYSFEEFSRLLG